MAAIETRKFVWDLSTLINEKPHWDLDYSMFVIRVNNQSGHLVQLGRSNYRKDTNIRLCGCL